MINLQGRGFEETAPRNEIMTSVMSVAGETKATRDRYMSALKRYGFVEQRGATEFVLHFEKVDTDDEIGMVGELTRRVSRLETIVATMRKGKEAEHDG